MINEGYIACYDGVNVWMTDEENYEMKNEEDIYVLKKDGENFYMALKGN